VRAWLQSAPPAVHARTARDTGGRHVPRLPDHQRAASPESSADAASHGNWQVAKFHLVVSGPCRLELDGHGAVPPAAGIWRSCCAAVGARCATSPAHQVGASIRSWRYPPGEDGKPTYGGHGATTRLLCGCFGLAEPLRDPDRTLLPRLLLSGAITAGPAARLTPVLTLLQQRPTEPGPEPRRSSPRSLTCSWRRHLATYCLPSLYRASLRPWAAVVGLSEDCGVSLSCCRGRRDAQLLIER
jgi:Cupin